MAIVFFDLMPTVPRPGELRKIFAGRSRTVLKKSFGGEFPGTGKIGLNIQPHEHYLVSELDSSEIWEFGRVSVARADVVKEHLQRFAPLIAQKHFIPLLADMIPTSSFGASLANILTKESWRSIRKPAFVQAGYVCQVCGEANGPVEGHEIWRFQNNPAQSGWGTQSLEGILCVCAECHEMFHPGLANVRGRSKQVLQRTRDVNAWSIKEYDSYVAYANRVHKKRSNQHWVLDMSKLNMRGPLVLKSKWSLEPDGFISGRSQLGSLRTRIVGATMLVE